MITGQTETLTPYGFYRIHKSFLVNLRHIDTLTASTVTCAGATLPVGRTYKAGLMQAYLTVMSGRSL